MALVLADAQCIPLADKSVHVCVTSPPYHKLRRYGIGVDKGEIGAERELEQYINNLVMVFREVRRTLRDDGTLWLNLGSAYAGSGGAHKENHANPGLSHSFERDGIACPSNDEQFKSLNLVMVPSLVALALQRDGWILRQEIVWLKVSPMPESVNGWRWEQHRIRVEMSKRATNEHQQNTDRQGAGIGSRAQREAYYENGNGKAKYIDCPGCPTCLPNGGLVLRKGSWRPTSATEKIFMFSKMDSYFCDAEAVREPNITKIQRRFTDTAPSDEGGALHRKPSMSYKYDGVVPGNPNGRNMWNYVVVDNDPAPEFLRWLSNQAEWESLSQRFQEESQNTNNGWFLTPANYSGPHYAAFCPDLPRCCILAGTSSRGVCKNCGSPWVRIVRKETVREHGGTRDMEKTPLNVVRAGWRESGAESETLGWKPSCTCNAGEPVPATILDVFVGSGTSVSVAIGLGRRGIGLDLSEKYLKLSRDRAPLLMTETVEMDESPAQLSFLEEN